VFIVADGLATRGELEVADVKGGRKDLAYPLPK
jgi:hypothetical protein